MKRQMGAKTSGNFWHIILGHGHCGGVGAQRIEIIKLIIMRQTKINKKTIMNATKKWSTGMHYTCTVARQAHHLGLRFRMCPTRREAYNKSKKKNSNSNNNDDNNNGNNGNNNDTAPPRIQ